jgi:tetratricopeptide (TPR) repeat protein
VVSLFAVVGALLVAGYFGQEPPATRAERELNQGLAAHNAGNLEVARQKYLQVLRLEPDSKLAHYNLGVLAQNAGNKEQALQLYNKALAKDPRFIPALFNLALVEQTSGQKEKAAELYRRIIEINPKQAAAHFNLGLLLGRDLGKGEEGSAELIKAIALAPELMSRLPSGVALVASPVPSAAAASPQGPKKK